jgi:hypothetical protein
MRDSRDGLLGCATVLPAGATKQRSFRLRGHRHLGAAIPLVGARDPRLAPYAAGKLRPVGSPTSIAKVMRRESYLAKVTRSIGTVPSLAPPRLLFGPIVLPGEAAIEGGLEARTSTPQATPEVTPVNSESTKPYERSRSLETKIGPSESVDTAPHASKPQATVSNAPEEPSRQGRERDSIPTVASAAQPGTSEQTRTAAGARPTRNEMVAPLPLAQPDRRRVPDVRGNASKPGRKTGFANVQHQRLDNSIPLQSAVAASQNSVARMTERSSSPRVDVKPYASSRVEAAQIVEPVGSVPAPSFARNEMTRRTADAAPPARATTPTHATSIVPPPRTRLEPPNLALRPRQNQRPLHQTNEPVGGVHIGSLEVRIIAPPPTPAPGLGPRPPAIHPPRHPVQSTHGVQPLARGFGSFGLVQM